MDPDNQKENKDENSYLVSSRRAAAKIIRSQIDNIYETSETDGQIDPYDKTHLTHVDPRAEQWKHYHTAWQNYYQKYYEGYYAHAYSQAKENYFKDQPKDEEAKEQDSNTKKEAVEELREILKSKISKSADKVKKSRHFKPIAAGLSVVIICLFLQYNSFIIGNIIAYISPGSIEVQNIVIDPDTEITVDPAPKLIIPKINVDVPVSYDIGNDSDSLKAAMRVGVAHFAIPGASSHPGEIGNTVISGHSSNDLFSNGQYKFIFAQLEKLQVGDTIYANYKSKRYTYIVTGTKVVAPNDVSALVYPTTKPVLTLLTCTPVGTATNRLLVMADQVSPDPSQSVATTNSTATEVTTMPGKQPTLLEWLFGQRD